MVSAFNWFAFSLQGVALSGFTLVWTYLFYQLSGTYSCLFRNERKS